MINFEPNTEGVFSMEEEPYRAAPGVAQSDLKMLAQSPAHYRWNKEHPTPPTPAMVLGTLTHTAILEPKRMGGGQPLFHVKPAGMKFSTKESRAWRDDHQDLPIITNDELDAMSGMARSVWDHPFASAMLERGESEQSVFVNHPGTGLLRKCRIDRTTTDDEGATVLMDLKTTDDASVIGFRRTATKLRYHLQAAYYVDAWKDLMGEEPGFGFIAVERDPPYAVCVHRVSPRALEAGRRRYEPLLETFKTCKEADNWPAYSDMFETFDVPAWEEREVGMDLEQGN